MSAQDASSPEFTQVTLEHSVQEILAAYRDGVRLLVNSITGLTDQQIRATPVEGTWSTLGVICHLVDFDLVYAERMHRVLAEELPPLRGGEPDQFASAIHESHRQATEELQLLGSLRSRMAGFLSQLPEEAWHKTGIHSSDGPVTLKTLLVRVTNHVPHHLTFIQEKRLALGLPAWPQSSRNSRPEHTALIRWQGQGQGFSEGEYSREHTWTFDGGITVPASPSPHVVPYPWSSETAIDPEEAYVASVASCHMLTFLWLASKAGFVVTGYEDEASGVMTKNDRRVPWVSQITLRPRITWSGDRQPSEPEISRLHHEAHEHCFIANSVKTEVIVDETDSTGDVSENPAT